MREREGFFMSKEKSTKKKGGCLKTVAIVLVVFVAIGLFMPSSDSDKKSNEAPKEDVKTDAPVEKVEEPKADVPKEHESALKKAQIYSDTMYMSKSGLFQQLTSEYGEQFSEEAAQYAVDSVKADWNKNALKKAEQYSDSMFMSKAGIFSQLTSEHGEKFTEEEAQYAIDNIKADWNANALKKAKEYQETMSMSPEAIRDQLSSEYGEKFTKEEADYAVNNLK